MQVLPSNISRSQPKLQILWPPPDAHLLAQPFDIRATVLKAHEGDELILSIHTYMDNTHESQNIGGKSDLYQRIGETPITFKTGLSPHLFIIKWHIIVYVDLNGHLLRESWQVNRTNVYSEWVHSMVTSVNILKSHIY